VREEALGVCQYARRLWCTSLFWYDSMHAAQKPSLSKLKFVTLDKESNMSTLWRQEESRFLRICSKEELVEKAQDIEVTIIPVKKSQEARYNLDPESFLLNRFWGRRLDVVAINEALQIVYVFRI